MNAEAEPSSDAREGFGALLGMLRARTPAALLAASSRLCSAVGGSADKSADKSAETPRPTAASDGSVVGEFGAETAEKNAEVPISPFSALSPSIAFAQVPLLSYFTRGTLSSS